MNVALMIVLAVLAALLLPVVLYFAVRYVVWPIIMGVGAFVLHIWRFVAGMVSDVVRFVGALLTMVVFSPMVVLNVAIGRWSASAHFGRAVSAEFKTALACVYRVGIGHPARLLLLHGLTEGIEKRVPAAVQAAPTRDTPRKRTGQFEGYTIVGSLRGGGSGGKLYVAEPDAVRRAGFERQGVYDVDRVVIKSFSLNDGSSLPQIVRESRALDAARKLGLVLDHEMGSDRFYYIMRYVPGDALGVVTTRLHADSGPQGLGDEQLCAAMDYTRDLVRTLGVYHQGGLWHKDVKPDNIIVHEGRAEVVDLGLVTPLRSAMTLTTHGTEYFRDPELVRMALRGVKVHQVDGAKFDIYAAGAVLYSMIENSFPAHGGLSQITKRCPEALRWIVRRSMAEYDSRYGSAQAMLADLQTVIDAEDPFAVKPAALPSFAGEEPDAPVMEPDLGFADAAAVARQPHPTPVAPAVPAVAASAAPARARPRIKRTSWWSGRYAASDVVAATPAASVQPPVQAPARTPAHRPEARPAPRAFAVVPQEARASAADQLKNARARVASAQSRAQGARRGRSKAGRAADKHAAGANFGVLLGLVTAGVLAFLFFVVSQREVAVTTPKVAVDVAPQPMVATDGQFAAVLEAPVPSAVADAVSQVRGALATASSTVAGMQMNAPLDGVRLVVVSDFRPPTDDAVRMQLEAGAISLRGIGAEVIGSVMASTDEDRAAGDEAVAGARAAVGTRAIDTVDALEALAEYAADAGFDALLWFEPMSGDGQARYALVTDNRSEAGELSNARGIGEVYESVIRHAMR